MEIMEQIRLDNGAAEREKPRENAEETSESVDSRVTHP
jgi:hypothetical protein